MQNIMIHIIVYSHFMCKEIDIVYPNVDLQSTSHRSTTTCQITTWPQSSTGLVWVITKAYLSHARAIWGHEKLGDCSTRTILNIHTRGLARLWRSWQTIIRILVLFSKCHTIYWQDIRFWCIRKDPPSYCLLLGVMWQFAHAIRSLQSSSYPNTQQPQWGAQHGIRPRTHTERAYYCVNGC